MCRRTIWLAVALLIGFMALSPGHAQDEIENILVNGGFEDGVETPWGTYGGVITEVVTELTGAAVPEGPIEGNFCLHIVVGAAGANFWEIGLNQTGLVFEAGKTYTLSVFLKSKEGALDINFKPELAQDPWTAPVEQAFVMTEEWAEYSITTGVISEDISPAEIVLHIGYAPGDFWIDGIRWYEGDYVPPNLGDKSVASLPVPEDGAIHPETWANLSWKPGDFAVSHDVYFGESLDDVHDGTEGTFQGNQSSTNFLVGFPGFLYPDGLVPGTTYYWRIDEVNEADPNSPWKGDVWSFSIPPKTAYFPDPIDGAEFVDLNARLRWTPGFGAKLHTVYLGDSFEDVNNATGGSPQGIVTYTPPSPLESEKVYYWRVDEFDVAATHKGDIWSFTTPGAVGNPQPANGVVDAQIVTTLNWTPADTAASSDLYLGIDADAVKSATTASPEYAGNKALGS
ncbi:MAG: carbohydrate binding domain-containing protein, partial [Planctomycetota bacterium]